MSYQTLHSSTGEKLENMNHVCKTLGLIGDPRVDQLHAMTHRIHQFINGDWRRMINADATGMDAMRFTTFSAGPGAMMFARVGYYIHNHPWEYRVASQTAEWRMIPKHVISSTQPDQTVYMTNVSYEMQCSNIFMNAWPMHARCYGDDSIYKHSIIQTMHPTDEYHAYCKADWERYHTLIKENRPGFEDIKDVPYPYSVADVFEFFRRITQ